MKDGALFFFLTCGVGVYVGRRFGWWMSRVHFYFGSRLAVFIDLILWGAGVAFLLRLAMNWLHPGIILKILGYGAGAYVAHPAYGLVMESTIPSEQQSRHAMINNLPFWTYAVVSGLLAFVSYRHG